MATVKCQQNKYEPQNVMYNASINIHNVDTRKGITIRYWRFKPVLLTVYVF